MPEVKKSNGRPLLADVARRAGVHISTVSRALQNSPLLPKNTRKKVQRIARKMGYRKDPRLTGLAEYRKQKRSPPLRETVAYISSWGLHETDLTSWKMPEQTPFFIEAKKVLEFHGYRLEHFSLRQPGLSPSVITQILKKQRTRGVMVGGFSHRAPRLELDWRHFCAVRVGFIPQWPELHTVGGHQFQIMNLAFEKALEAGYRRIGVTLTEGMDDNTHRAYSASVALQQLQCPSNERLPVNLHPWGNARHFLAWFMQYCPEVVIGTLQEWRWLKEVGINIPRDAAFISLQKNRQDPEMSGVSGICCEHSYCGQKAVEVLTSLILHSEYGVPPVPTFTLVPGSWSPGATLPAKKRK